MATLLCHTQTAAPGAGRQQAGEAGARGVFARAFCFTHTTPLRGRWARDPLYRCAA